MPSSLTLNWRPWLVLRGKKKSVFPETLHIIIRGCRTRCWSVHECFYMQYDSYANPLHHIQWKHLWERKCIPLCSYGEYSQWKANVSGNMGPESGLTIHNLQLCVSKLSSRRVTTRAGNENTHQSTRLRESAFSPSHEHIEPVLDIFV